MEVRAKCMMTMQGQRLRLICRTPEKDTMWQLHASSRSGDYRRPELDGTPALGIIVAVIGLIIRMGL